MISVTDAAQIKKCSRQAIYDAIKSVKIRSQRIGKILLVEDDAQFSAWKPDPIRQAAGRLVGDKSKRQKTDVWS